MFSTQRLRVLSSPKNTYWADPFLWDEYIFFEELDRVKGKGHISSMKMGEFKPQIVLERPYHLSFPFLIEEEGDVYMVPETGQAGRIELYRAKKFPYEWEFVKVMIEGIVVGDTVIYKNGKDLLMFTTEGDNSLRIFQSNSVLGEWEKIYSEDHIHSRSAGNLFKENGKLIRPVQDGEVYGRQIFFKEIELAPYREKIVVEIKPDWYPGLTGTHTFNFNDKYIVIDGRIAL